MSGLVSIEDLLRLPAEMVVKYEQWASDIGVLYEQFIRTDDADVEFMAGWHGAKSRSAGIHASEMSGGCRRPVWYSLKGEQRQDNELDPFWKKRFRIGHMYHAMIQEDLRRFCENSGGFYTFESEVKIHPELQIIAKEYDIHSSSDGVIGFRDHPNGPVVLRLGLEIKTESPAQYEALKGPKEAHQRQTCVYMKCLDVPLMWTMYVNKGNQNVVPSKHPYLFPFDFKLWGQIERETKEVIHLSVVNELPDRTESIVCEFCGYSWTCKPPSLEKKKKREAGRKARAEQTKRLNKMASGGLRVPKGNT